MRRETLEPGSNVALELAQERLQATLQDLDRLLETQQSIERRREAAERRLDAFALSEFEYVSLPQVSQSS